MSNFTNKKTHGHWVPPDMPHCGRSIPLGIWLPPGCNLNLIMRKHQTKAKYVAFKNTKIIKDKDSPRNCPGFDKYTVVL